MSLPQSKHKVGMGIVLDKLTKKADVSVGKYEEAVDSRDGVRGPCWGFIEQEAVVSFGSSRVHVDGVLGDKLQEGSQSGRCWIKP